MNPETWVVKVEGPNGVKLVELTVKSVSDYRKLLDAKDEYACAAWLAGWAIDAGKK